MRHEPTRPDADRPPPPAFDHSAEGESLLRAFGTRAFGAEGLKPWEGNGWSAFLNSVVQPVIDSTEGRLKLRALNEGSDRG